MKDKKDTLKPALEKGRKALREIWKENKSKLDQICGCSVDKSTFTLPYFTEKYRFTMPECTVSPEDISPYELILLLHYCSRPFENTAAQDQCREEWITFKQLPNAEFYNTTYQKRGPNKIIERFAQAPSELIDGGKALEGEPGTYGDYSIILQPFPKIRSMAVLYAGDEELPPEAEILYTSNINRFLPLEDTAVLAGIIARRLQKAADRKKR